MTKWKEIWNKRDTSQIDFTTTQLQDLIHADGFDSGAGKIDVESWKQYISFIEDKIHMEENDSIFEVGCGSGAFLHLWYSQGHVVGGIDYSESLIWLAQNVFKGHEFSLCEADQLDVSNKYDVVVANSVFHYFKNYQYAQEVLDRMVQKARKTIAILEIPDRAEQQESERARMEALSPAEYKQKYEGLPHLYYDREWFLHFAERQYLDIDIFDQNISNYGNNTFRFNVVLTK